MYHLVKSTTCNKHLFRHLNGAEKWAVGSGPARMAYHGALISRVHSSAQWHQHGDSYMLNLTAGSDYVSDASLLKYKLDGVLAALTIIHLLVELYPISPFVILTACVPGGRELREIGHQLIGLIPDRKSRQLVSSILDFRRTKTVPPGKVGKDLVASKACELDGIEVSLGCVSLQVIKLTLEGCIFPRTLGSVCT
jgi:hypothetical protein